MDEFKYKNRDLLNKLSDMQRAPYYAIACHTLVKAEMVIAEQERRIAELEQGMRSFLCNATRLAAKWDGAIYGEGLLSVDIGDDICYELKMEKDFS